MSKTRALFALARDSASDDLLCCLCFLWLFSFTALQAPSALSGAVEDETKQPVPGVQVTLHSGAAIQLTSTNEAGRFRFDSLPAGDYSLDFDKAGFFRLTNYTVTVGTPSTEIIVTMNHEYEIRSKSTSCPLRTRLFRSRRGMSKSSSRTRFAKIRFPVLIIFKMPCPQYRESCRTELASKR